MDDGHEESNEQEVTGSSSRKMFDNRVFKLHIKPLPGEADAEFVLKWITELLHVVTAQSGGHILVTVFNFYCGIKEPTATVKTVEDDEAWNFAESRQKKVLYPSEDSPKFAPADNISTNSTSSIYCSTKMSQSRFRTQFRAPEGMNPSEWSPTVSSLDTDMFAALTNLVKGKYMSIVSQAGIPVASFVKALCYIHHEATRDALPDTLKILEGAMELKYRNDPHKFEVEAKKMVSGLINLKITPELLSVMCIFKAFKGDSTAEMLTRNQLADFIQQTEINESTPIYDIITTTCEFMSRMKSPTGKINFNADSNSENGGKKCTRCGKPDGTCRTYNINGSTKCVEWRDTQGKLVPLPKDYTGPRPRQSRPKEEQVNVTETTETEKTDPDPATDSKRSANKILQKLKTAKVNMVKEVKFHQSVPLTTPLTPEVRHHILSCKRIILSLCSGIDMPRQAAIEAGLEFDAWISVEKDEGAREMALFLASKDDKPSPIYISYDIYEINKQFLQEHFTPNTIFGVLGCPPCKSLSGLLLLPRFDGKKPVRPGLNSIEGHKTLQVANVIDAVKEDHTPYVVVEQVDFSDMQEDFALAKKRLGPYEIINSLHHAFLHRKRLFFINFLLRKKIKDKYPSMKNETNGLLDPGREIDLSQGHPTLTASYKLKSEREQSLETNCTQTYVNSTSRPLKIIDSITGKTETCRVEEAERLMGMVTGSTALPGVSDIARLTALGNGVCVITFCMIFEAMMDSEEDLKIKKQLPNLRIMINQGKEEELTAWIAQFTGNDTSKIQDVENKIIDLMQSETVLHTFKGEEVKGTAIDSGATSHVFSSGLDSCDPHNKRTLSGFGTGMEAQTDGMGTKALALVTTTGKQQTITLSDVNLVKQSNRNLISMGKKANEGFSFYIGAYGKQSYMTLPNGERVKIILGDDGIPILPHAESVNVKTLKSERANFVANHPQPTVSYYSPEDPEDGFRAHQPEDHPRTFERISAIAANSAQSDSDSDELPELVYLSDSEETISTSSDSESDDDTPIDDTPIPETARPMTVNTLNQADPMTIPCKDIARQIATFTSRTLHDIMNGASQHKVTKTLEVTRGIKAVVLPKVNCEVCPQTKMKRYPDRQTKSNDRELVLFSEITDEMSEESASESEDEALDTFKALGPVTTQDEHNPVSFEEEHDGDSDSLEEELQVTAETTVAVPLHNEPRFQHARPFEFVFVDNKDFSGFGPQEGGIVMVLLMYDYYSTTIAVYRLTTKVDNSKGLAYFSAEFGWSKLPYKVTVLSDSCGSMAHIKAECSELGLAYKPLPPHHPNRNEAEGGIYTVWSAAMHSHVTANRPPAKHFHRAVDLAAHMHMYMATTESRKYKTPYELITGKIPSIVHFCRYWTKAYVKMPKHVVKRLGSRDPDQTGTIAYIGRFVGFHHWDSTTKTILVGNSTTVNSIDVTMDHNDYRFSKDVNDFTYKAPQVKRSIVLPLTTHTQLGNSHHEGVPHDAEGGETTEPDFEMRSWDSTQSFEVEEVLESRINEDGTLQWLVSWANYDGPPTWEEETNLEHAQEAIATRKQIENDDAQQLPETFPSNSDSEAEEESDSSSHGLNPTMPRIAGEINTDNIIEGPRLRPSINCIQEALTKNYSPILEREQVCLADSSPRTPSLSEQRQEFLRKVDRLTVKVESFELKVLKELEKINKQKEKKLDHQLHTLVCQILSASSMDDISWVKALKDPALREKAIEALNKEKKALSSTILTLMSSDDADWDIAIKKAVSGRYILTIKRNGIVKARGVKQGFKEDKSQADGPQFNYFSHVARLDTIRQALCRPNRGTRCIATKDISVAFLQAYGYDGFVKYVCFRDPVTGIWEYFRQSGPIYGEASAPVRWEDTFSDFLVVNMKFERGDNEKCVYYHVARDLLIVTYVDDVFADGERHDIEWFFEALNKRFECKDAEWLTPTNTIDHLGMEISMNQESIYLSMNKYILDMLHALDYMHLQGSKYNTPIIKPIDADSGALSWEDKAKFMKGVGMLGWLKETGRPDVAYAHSRISQHMANPNESSLEALKHCAGYLKATSHLAIKSNLYNEDEFAGKLTTDSTNGWRFFSDSDFAGNSEPQNKRRSQNGGIATLNGAPVFWTSKVSSVAFAHPDIGEAHADMSSAAAEIYAASNACCDFLHLGYVSGEMNIDFPTPFILEVDNQAAEIFINDTAFKSKLKHIDCRQEWVKTLRNRNIMVPKHVPTKENLADLFTKILDRETFTKLRDYIMHPHPATQLKSALFNGVHMVHDFKQTNDFSVWDLD